MSRRGAPTAAEIFGAEPSLTDGVPRDFRRIDEGHYRLTLEQLGIEFVVDRLRRKWDELIGELTVRCDMAGARTFDGVLSVADFNLSSARARQERAKLLAERSKATDLDWAGLLEEFVQRVLTAERTGEPAIDLCAMEAPPAAETLEIDGLRLVRDHQAILFGDGGSIKSYLSLYVAGRLTQQGHRVLFADWELDAVDHHQRLRRLFRVDLAPLYYVRCDRPLTAELDRLRRLVREHAITYVILDSVAYGCDGPPEAAEVANRYCRAVRQLRVGALLTAHINRSDSGDQKPFGSCYWHNSARVTWFAKAETTAPDGRTATIGLFNRKFNHGPPLPAVAFDVTFEDERTVFRRTSVADNPDLAVRLPLWQRMAHLLRRGPVPVAEIAEQLEVAENSVLKTITRKTQLFTRVPSTSGVSRIALVERRPA